MRLSKVEYELFDFEEVSPEATVLSRQIRLRFSDAPVLYISWTMERQSGVDSPAYSIGFSTDSYFFDVATLIADASSSTTWSALIDTDVALDFVDEHFQTLRIASAEASVFCSAADMDEVHVSLVLPG